MILYAPSLAEDEDLPPAQALWVIDYMVKNLPEHARPAARRQILRFFADAYDAAGDSYPEWLRVGLDRVEDPGFSSDPRSFTPEHPEE